MKRALCASIVVFAFAGLTGCGPQLSNEDIEFLYALPSKDSLKAQLPDDATGTTSNGLQIRKNGLAVGDPSKAYADTKKGGDDLNNGLAQILGAIDFVRSQNPSKRADNYRMWGPWTDQKDPTRQLRIVIRFFPGDTPHYEWSIDTKFKTEAESEWFSAIVGTYAPTSDVRVGSGTLTFDAVKARAAKKLGADDDGNLKTLAITYDTGSEPHVIELKIDAVNAHLDYEYREFADHSGDLEFDLTADWVKTTVTPETLRVTAAWVGLGAGRADYGVYGGDTPLKPDLTTASRESPYNAGDECWDANFNLVFHRDHFNAANDVGVETNCALADPNGPGADQ